MKAETKKRIAELNREMDRVNKSNLRADVKIEKWRVLHNEREALLLADKKVEIPNNRYMAFHLDYFGELAETSTELAVMQAALATDETNCNYFGA